MRVYLIRRLLLIIPTVFLTSIIIFFAIRLVPGSVIDIMESQYSAFYHVDRAELEKRLGLDVSAVKQYGRWIGVTAQADGKIHGILEGDFGQSIWHQNSVLNDQIGERWQITLELTLMSLIIGLLIALPIGIFSALRQNSWGDYVARTFTILCIAVPSFWLGTLVIVYPSIWWNFTISIQYVKINVDPLKNLGNFILPAVVLGMGMAGVTMRMMRTMMLEVLRQDYVRTAWAKGLRERVVVMRHALKNALIPVITIIGMQVSFLIGGDVIIEQIFNLPGLGRLLVTATQQRDYPIVQGVLLFFALAMVLINLLVDLTYGFFDPRVSYK